MARGGAEGARSISDTSRPRKRLAPPSAGQLFKKTYGVYFNEHLLQIRIPEAKRQLRQTDRKVYETAANVGFGNSDYFVIEKQASP
ncbi:helix-turn-helix domain-containing protein [Cohnella sp. LGH]|nr:helix-turn-helix domain-containing protein [Cohnella sp. LGH]